MSERPVNYWLTEAFCKEHGHKGPRALQRENNDASVSAWKDRRANMRKKWPDLVPMLDSTARLSRTEKPDVSDADMAHSSEVSMHADGSYTSDRLIRMSEEQSKDRSYLLAAHGFNADEWEIVNARSSMWHMGYKDDGCADREVLYSSKVTVRPRSDTLDIGALIAACELVTPRYIEQPARGDMMLEVGVVDAHFGNSDLALYEPTLERILSHITRRTWSQVVLPIGNDLFHVDNFKNTTSNGTPQSSVAWPEAWADALEFYSTIIEFALQHSEVVYAYYIIGNHDESMSWAFCQMLAAKYPQVRFDVAIEERKVHVFGDIAVGFTHGDGRTRKDVDRVFMAEFPEFSGARVREVHAAHHHHEVTVDEFGVVVRTLSTAARTDKWHREEGYVGACKRFQAFEYTLHSLDSVHYV